MSLQRLTQIGVPVGIVMIVVMLVVPLPPVVLGGLLVAPTGLIRAMGGQPQASAQTVIDTQAAAARAREIVMEVERGLGFVPADRESSSSVQNRSVGSVATQTSVTTARASIGASPRAARSRSSLARM